MISPKRKSSKRKSSKRNVIFNMNSDSKILGVYNRKNGSNIIAVGDIHADLDVFLNILDMTGLATIKYPNVCWNGGNNILVLCGDVLDGKRINVSGERYLSSEQELQIINIIENIQKTARENGGDVIWLLGNHDYGNLVNNDFVEKYRYNTTQSLKEKLRQYYSKNPLVICRIDNWIFCHGGISEKMIKNISNTLKKKNND